MTRRIVIEPGLYRTIHDHWEPDDPRQEFASEGLIPEHEIWKSEIYAINGDMIMRNDNFSEAKDNKLFGYILYPFFRDGRVRFVAEGIFSTFYIERYGSSLVLVKEEDIQEHIRANLGRELHPIAAAFVDRLPGKGFQRKRE